MKRIIVRLSFLLLTFSVGFAAVWLIGLLTAVSPSVENKTLSNDHLAETPVSQIPVTAPKQKPRFTGTFRGCGFGYTQGYKTDDGQQLSEGITGTATRKKAHAEFKKRVAESVRVIERVPNYKNRLGKLGERVVMINPPDGRNPEETVSILWHDGGQFIAFINAPSLDLALEFEQFLEATDYIGY